MRSIDVIANQVNPGTIVVDRTCSDDVPISLVRLPENFGVEYRPVLPMFGEIAPSSRLVVAEWLKRDAPTRMARSQVAQGGASAAAPPSAGTRGSAGEGIEETMEAVLSLQLVTPPTLVVLADTPELFVEAGLFEEAAQRRWRIVAAELLDHSAPTAALVLRPVDDGADLTFNREVLRVVNEHRYQDLALRFSDLEKRALEKQVDERAREAKTLQSELEAARSSAAKRDPRRAGAGARARSLLSRVDVLRAVASSNVSRRARALLRDLREDPLGSSERWLKGLAAGQPAIGRLAPRKRTPSLVPEETIAREHFLGGAHLMFGLRPGIATVCSRSLEEELSAVLRVCALTPNAFAFQLEIEQPAFVLVTADAFLPYEPWGGFGVLEGRDVSETVAALQTVCRRRRIPMVYWENASASQLLAHSLRRIPYDAVFADSHGRLETLKSVGVKAEILRPGIALTVFNPIGGQSAPPTAAVCPLTWSRMGPHPLTAEERHVLEAVGVRNLVLLDESFQDPQAGVQDCPRGSHVEHRLRPAPSREAHVLRNAGVHIDLGRSDPDAMSVDVLRAIAVGSHVLTMSTHVLDQSLEPALTRASAERARPALDLLFDRPRQGSEWSSAFASLLENYDLRDRVQAIGRALAIDAPVAPVPNVAVCALVTSDSERHAFDRFVHENRWAVDEVIVSTSVDALALACRDVKSTYAMSWRADVAMPPGALIELRALARMSDADVLEVVELPAGANVGTKETAPSSASSVPSAASSLTEASSSSEPAPVAMGYAERISSSFEAVVGDAIAARRPAGLFASRASAVRCDLFSPGAPPQGLPETWLSEALRQGRRVLTRTLHPRTSSHDRRIHP